MHYDAESGLFLPRSKKALHERRLLEVKHQQLLMANAGETLQTWNPADTSVDITISGGNLIATRGAAAAAYRSVRALQSVSGKRYWELEVTSNGGDSPMFAMIGVAQASASLGTYIGAGGTTSWGMAIRDGVYYYDTHQGAPDAFFLPNATTGDILMCAYDGSTNELWVGKNGTWYNSYFGAGWPITDVAAGINEQNILTGSGWFPAVSIYRPTAIITGKFTNASLTYPKPTGFSTF